MMLFGGQSSEHDVSILSAQNIASALGDMDCTVYYVFIDHSGSWKLVQSVDERNDGETVMLDFSMKTFSTPSKNAIRPDVMFPVLHGKHGEDGSIQGLAAMIDIPCVGPSILSAAVTMNKDMTKRLAREAGVPVVDWSIWHTNDEAPSYETLQSQYGSSLFVKPNAAGSSVGASKVTTSEELAAALNIASQHDTMVIIEPALDVREIEIAVRGNEVIDITMAGEIIPGETFYSYEDKYSQNSSSTVRIPADLDEQTVRVLEKYAHTSYRATGGHGMARIDFFIDKNNHQMYLNEINSIPGFTDASMYPKLWLQNNLSYKELIDSLISLAR